MRDLFRNGCSDAQSQMQCARIRKRAGFVILAILHLSLRVANGQEQEWFWATLPRVEPLNAPELAVAAALLNNMARTTYTESGVVDMRSNERADPAYIDYKDGNLLAAVLERFENRTSDDLMVEINDFVDQHIERLQTNSLLQMEWKERGKDESLEFKMHTFGCTLWVIFLRWSAAWNADYVSGNCSVILVTDSGTTDEVAGNNVANFTLPDTFDPDGPVNAQWGCIQARALNNMEPRSRIEGTGGIKLTRYSLGGTANLFLDLETFNQKLGHRDVRVHEVRHVTKYSTPSSGWHLFGHQSIPMDLEQDAKDEHPADARFFFPLGNCARQFLRDRSRIRHKAVEVGSTKAREALIAAKKPSLTQIRQPTILAATAASIVAIVTTSPKVGDFFLHQLMDRKLCLPHVGSIALSLEFFSQLVFSTALHVIVYDEVRRQLSNTVQSVIFITTAEYDNANGLSAQAASPESSELHLLNMVQVSRRADTSALISAVFMEAILLVIGLGNLLGVRRKAIKAAVADGNKVERAC